MLGSWIFLIPQLRRRRVNFWLCPESPRSLLESGLVTEADVIPSGCLRQPGFVIQRTQVTEVNIGVPLTSSPTQFGRTQICRLPRLLGSIVRLQTLTPCSS